MSSLSNLETKVDALIRAVLAKNSAEFDEAEETLKKLVQAPKPPKDTEDMIRDLLLEIGMPDKLTGHRFAAEAIRLVVEDESLAHMLTKGLYPAVAKSCGVTPRSVERCIRHAVEVAYDRCDLATIERYFGNTVSQYSCKPTNGEFISRMANVIRLRMKEEHDA